MPSASGVRTSLGISLIVAAELLAINALAAIQKDDGSAFLPGLGGKPLIPYIGEIFAGGWFMVLFFVLFAVQSLQLLQAAEKTPLARRSLGGLTRLAASFCERSRLAASFCERFSFSRELLRAL